MPSPARRQAGAFSEPRSVAEYWTHRLHAALADKGRAPPFLPLAESALAACPQDARVLLLAATAALLDARPQWAVALLERCAPASGAAVHLLTALALHQSHARAAARMVLERHALTTWPAALAAFPAGVARLPWLIAQLDAICGRRTPRPRPRLAGGKGREAPTATSTARKSGEREVRAPRAAPAEHPALPRLEIDIPFSLELDLAPLSAAMTAAAEQDGRFFLLRERLAHLGLAQGFDELFCLPHLIGFEPLDHQIETVRKVLKQFRGRVLLADEVGLGKTIEACMALKEYALRGMAEHTLVLTPASLVGQWREELESKFGLAFATTYDPLLREDPQAFWEQNRIVASLATARRREHADCLLQRQYDLIIVDEAHHLRDRASASWKLVDALNKRFLLLLSATPVQNDLIELYNLLTLLKPGIFKTPEEFRASYMTPGRPRQPANSERLRALMRDCMIRNTRAVVALKLPRRNALTIHVDGEGEEAGAYAELAAAVRSAAAHGARGRLGAHRLLAAAGSSPAAAARALERLVAADPANADWARLAARFSAIRGGGKISALISLVTRNPREKKLIFFNARETLSDVALRLAEAGIAAARFDGSMSGAQKDEAVALFRDGVSVLLCTQTGGEGRNVQFCNTLINFDIPYNPMAIEQRIGRIDRIGQEREVFVFNLVMRGTLEEQVLMLLEEKIAMFELVVGEVGAILGGLEQEREFSELALDAWLEATEAKRAEAFAALGARLDAARRQHEDAKALDGRLFGEDFEAA
jgi:superfamily II DNA or RNA helicase